MEMKTKEKELEMEERFKEREARMEDGGENDINVWCGYENGRQGQYITAL